MVTLFESIERGCEIHPAQCYQTGFAPSPPGSPCKACVIGAAHAGYADLTGRPGIEPSFFTVGGATLSAARELGNHAHPLNIELRTREIGGETLQDHMAILNDEHEVPRKEIAHDIRDSLGKVHLRHE